MATHLQVIMQQKDVTPTRQASMLATCISDKRTMRQLLSPQSPAPKPGLTAASRHPTSASMTAKFAKNRRERWGSELVAQVLTLWVTMAQRAVTPINQVANTLAMHIVARVVARTQQLQKRSRQCLEIRRGSVGLR